MGDFRQWVVLIHELRQLARAKEFFHRSRYWLCVDQILWHQALALRHGEALFDRALDTNQTDSELVLCHFAHRADTTVTEVIDIIDNTLTVTNVDQSLKDCNDIFFVERATASDLIATKTAIELHATHGREIIAISREEQVLE